MRDSTPRDWHRWRATARPTPPAAHDRMSRLPLPPVADVDPVSADVRADEVAGPDGVRHELVERIRRQIADGTYDTEERWLRAEEALIRRVCGK